MFKNILVPTDLSEKCLKALDIAVKMGSKDERKITLLHVIEIIEDADDEEFKDFYGRLKERARKKMDEMANRYGDQKLNIHLEIVYGKRVKEIVKFAYENEMDLIVLSSHKIDKIDAAEGWATISYRVGILSHCPVMMVK
ncbi:MAG: universal stress protein [Pseudomonadota bacterium]